MADEAAAPEAAASDKKKGMLPVILAVVGTLVVAGAGGLAGGYFLFGGDKPAAAADAAGADGAKAPASGDAMVPDLGPSSEVISLGAFTVNLRDSAGGRLLQMDVSVEGDGSAGTMVEEREAQLRDAILMLASDYTYLELEGVDGKMRLRDEIHRRVNMVLAPEKVSRVYFTAFVVQ